MLPRPGHLNVYNNYPKRPAYSEAFLGFVSVAFTPRHGDCPVSFNVLLCAYPRRRTFHQTWLKLEGWNRQFPGAGRRFVPVVPERVRAFVHGLLLEPPADRPGEILAFSMLLDLLIEHCAEFRQWFDRVTSPGPRPSGIS